MVDKKISLLVLSLLFPGIIVSMSCGCFETDSKSGESGDTDLGFSIVRHEFLYGLMEPKYDVRIWEMGSDVVDVQGVKRSELKGYFDEYMKEDTQSTTELDPVYYQPTLTPVPTKEAVYIDINTVVYT